MLQSLASQLTLNPATGRLEWIVDLAAMRPFWSDWFVQLTDNFLAFTGSRMLVLADADCMDRRMIVAQMQGKFQLVVVPDSGHAVQEDQPVALADAIGSMIQKHLKLSLLLRERPVLQ